MTTDTQQNPGSSSAPGPDQPRGREPGAPRRLHRSRSQRLVGGVGGGIAEYFGIDPVIVRIAIVVLTVAGGFGAVAYAAAWFLIPDADGTAFVTRRRGHHASARQLGAFALVGVGGLLLLDRLGLGIDEGIAWPFVLIAGGAAVLWGQSRDRHDGPSGGSGGFQGPGHSGGSRGTGSSGGPGQPGGSSEAAESAVSSPPPSGDAAGQEPLTDETAIRRDSDPQRFGPDRFGPDRFGHDRFDHDRFDRHGWTRRAGRTAFSRAALGLLAALVGISALATRHMPVGDRAERVGAIALIGIGVLLVLGSFFGRPRGFVFLGVVLAALLALSATINVSFRGGIGDRAYRPTTAELKSTYELSIGNLELDLTNVDMRGRRVRTKAEVSIGHLLIEVPSDVRVVVNGRAGLGAIDIFDHEQDGARVHATRTSPGIDESAGTLYLDARAGIGLVEIVRSSAPRRVTDKARA